MKIKAEEVAKLAIIDLLDGFRKKELWWFFALHDIKQRFRRSILGPFWLTLSTGIMISALGIVFGTLFQQEMGSFLPYVTTGIVFWSFISAIITESCTVFITSAGYIRSVSMPLSSHFYRMFARNFIILCHNMTIYIVVFFIFQRDLNLNYVLFIPGFLLLAGNLFWIGLMAAIFSTRYRDINQIITNLLTVIFFMTPIFWRIDLFSDRLAFIKFNLFYHLIEIVRSPLLGNMPGARSWIISIAALILGMLCTLPFYRRTYARIPYWI